MYSKETIYELALSALLLDREVSEVATDESNEIRVLNTHYQIALNSTLSDLDLDSTSTTKILEKKAQLEEGEFKCVYRYPTDCVFLRRIVSGCATDNRYSHIAKRTGMYNGQKCIFTNHENAELEYISNDILLSELSPMLGLAVAYKLAYLSAPLITGKGAKRLRNDIKEDYLLAKHDAQENDSNENFRYESDETRSEFVAERIS